jgi:CheY-like chemotaxis protein
MFGYIVIEAENGQQAVKSAQQYHPDLILMDMSMPVMDGLTATKAIRVFNEKPKIPIIAVTAFGKQYYERAMEAGCNDLISKPVDFDVLQPVIEQYLAQ